MPTTYRATLTNVGAALVADAIAHGTTLTWAKMALGDGNGSAVIVDAGRTSLVNERYRAPLNDLGRDSANPNTIVGTLVVPPETGGWTIREFGIYDNASTPRLVAYGETPEIEKPASAAGTGINLRLRFRLAVSADANITLSPDSNEAYATIEYVKDNAVKSLSVSGRTITYTMGDGDTHTIQTQDTTYCDATQSVHGLMSAEDKILLDYVPNTYVNKNGDTMIGALRFAYGQTDYSGMIIPQICGSVAGSDLWRIGIGATASDAGFLEIATGDNGNEPIYFSQYSGNVEFANLRRRATLLDANGNTVFPGNVRSLGSFIGKHIRQNVDDDYLWLGGGTNYSNGGHIYLNGKDLDDGSVSIYANNGVISKRLYLQADGTIEWDNKKLLTISSLATQSEAGAMSPDDKLKLDGIATGAEVNQNAFSNVKVGSNTIQADGKTDTLELAAGTGIALTTDTANDKVTVKVKDDTYLPLAGGTMTGSISTSNSNFGKSTTTNSELRILGGTDLSDGAAFIAYGKDNANGGAFRIRSYGNYDLVGNSQGKLTWKGFELNPLKYTLFTDNYSICEYEDKFQIIATSATAANEDTINFPRAFSKIPIVLCEHPGTVAVHAQAHSITTTGFKVAHTYSSAVTIKYIAIGLGV